MHTASISAHRATSIQILFEGRSRIGRTYRVTAVGDEALLFDREFDYAPGKWHREGAVRFPAEGYEWALSRHIAGGDGLEYLPDALLKATARSRLVLVAGSIAAGKSTTLHHLALLDPTLALFQAEDGSDTLRKPSDLAAFRAAVAFSPRVAAAIHATPGGLHQRLMDLSGNDLAFLHGVTTIAVHVTQTDGQLIQTISRVNWLKGTTRRLSTKSEPLTHNLIPQGPICHDAAARHVEGYLH